MVVFIFIFYFKIYCLPGHFLFVQYADDTTFNFSGKSKSFLDPYATKYLNNLVQL